MTLSTRHYGYLALALVIATLIALYWVLPDYREWVDRVWSIISSGDQEKMSRWFTSLGAWGPVIIVLLMILQMFMLVLPSVLLMIVSVLAYGSFWGAVLSVAAVAAAAAVGYAIGRLAGSPLLNRLMGKDTLGRVRRESERYGLWAVIIARINPLLSNDAISVAGGMVELGFTRFMLATLAGITPLAVAIALMGENWEQMKSGLIWLSFLSLAGLGLKVWADKRHRSGTDTSAQDASVRR